MFSPKLLLILFGKRSIYDIIGSVIQSPFFPSNIFFLCFILCMCFQALQLGQELYSPYGITSQRCHMCLRSDPLHKVMERLSKPGVRRLFVVEAGSKRVEGIISLSDIFRFLVGQKGAVKSLFSVAQILSNIQLGKLGRPRIGLFLGHQARERGM